MTPLAKRLRKLGMSQRKLAKIAGLSEPEISVLVAGRHDPLLKNAHKIARILKCDPFKLFPPRRRRR